MACAFGAASHTKPNTQQSTRQEKPKKKLSNNIIPAHIQQKIINSAETL